MEPKSDNALGSPGWPGGETAPRGAAYELFDHDADIGVRGYGPTPEEAFEQAALALSAVVTEPAGIRPDQVVEVECQGNDLELLFVDWLNAVIFEAATRRMLFGRFEVKIASGTLHGRLFGETVDPDRHRPAVEPKGATYTQLRVAREPDGRYVAQCIIDV